MSVLPSFCDTKRWVREISVEVDEDLSARTCHRIARFCMAVWAGDVEPTISYRDPVGAEVVRRVLARVGML